MSGVMSPFWELGKQLCDLCMVCDQQLTCHNNSSSMLWHMHSKHLHVADGCTSAGGETSGVLYIDKVCIKSSGPLSAKSEEKTTATRHQSLKLCLLYKCHELHIIQFIIQYISHFNFILARQKDIDDALVNIIKDSQPLSMAFVVCASYKTEGHGFCKIQSD